MSLGVAFKGPEGIVLAADSRVTLHAQVDSGGGQQMLVPASFDNAKKLLSVTGQDYVGAVTYGVGAIGQPPRTPQSFLPEFEDELEEDDVGRLGVEEFAERMSEFYLRQWRARMPDEAPGGDMVFLVGGIDEGDAYGRVFQFGIPSSPQPEEQNPGEGDFGMTWGGQLMFASRVINGFDPSLPEHVQQHLGLSDEEKGELHQYLKNQLSSPLPYAFLPLQDCVDLSILLVRMTAKLLNFMVDTRGTGGAVDVAVITRTDGFDPIQQKELTGRSEPIL